MDNSNNLVQLGLSQDLIKPIVQKEIHAAVVAALGGTDELISKVVHNIVTTKVNSKGEVSSYSSDNKYTWLEYAVTNRVRDIIKEELEVQIKENTSSLKKAIIKTLRSEKGSSQLADALLEAFSNTIDSNWKSNIEITIEKPKSYY